MSHVPESDGVIRITPADVSSPHVDDLLNRQAALRGEMGIGARRTRRWYYSNWFVFMLAGALGALAAWALIEPSFDDLLYVQGKVDIVDVGRQDWEPVVMGDDEVLDLEDMAAGSFTLNGQLIWLLSITQSIDADGNVVPFDAESLTEGREVGAHVEFIENPLGGDIVLARFIDLDPPPGGGDPGNMGQLSAGQAAVALLLFPVVAALTGLAIGAADGLVCRLWRRVWLAGAVGLVIGFIGGFCSQFLAGLAYAPLNMLAMRQMGEGPGDLTTMGFITQMGGRGLAWALAGMAMGLGQGIALRSGRLLLYGFLGGAIGGLLGGLLFDPIDLLLLDPDKPSAHISRLIGLTIIGATVGLMIGVVELLARDAWLNMVQGPLAGKEFLLFKDLLYVGASPKSDIYLFNDQQVAERHAVIRAAADQYEIEGIDPMYPVLLNGRPVSRSRLRHGDQITLGKTVFVFNRRRTG